MHNAEVVTKDVELVEVEENNEQLSDSSNCFVYRHVLCVFPVFLLPLATLSEVFYTTCVSFR